MDCCRGAGCELPRSATELLRQRVERLDSERIPGAPFGDDRQLLHFLAVMQSYTDAMMDVESGGHLTLTPDEADDITESCGLLDDIAEVEPEIVAGSIPVGRQHWIATGRNLAAPSSARFIEPAPHRKPATKPFHLGLYTSTAARSGRGMWRHYLDLNAGSSLHPFPWHTWKLDLPAQISVLDISTAREWAEFVQTYGRENSGLIYPDWRLVASEFDGVRLTLRAIVAIQGFHLATGQGRAAATFWDLESTLWLRWRFVAERLLEVAQEPA